MATDCNNSINTGVSQADKAQCREARRETADPADSREACRETADPADDREACRETADPADSREARKETADPADSREAGRETAGKTEYTEAQKEIADKAHALILENPGRHITIAELAEALHVSPTQVKVCFRKVYGAPVYSYARRYRMEKAAGILADTEESILEIAGRFGYENGSKFARAFRSVIGISPAEYRRRIRWERENPS